MKVVLYELRHLRESGFFRFLFRSLRRHGSAVEVREERPVERLIGERGPHDGAWVELDGCLVFFDMSDHVFDFDWQALQRADCYFKANFNRAYAERLLAEKGLGAHLRRIRPFTFLAPTLSKCAGYRRIGSRALSMPPLRGADLFHVVGVYENPVREGVENPFGKTTRSVAPHEMHFWIRRNFSQRLEKLEPSAFSRLVSRRNTAIEDGVNVFPNLNHWVYLWKMLGARFTVINTFPHAVYPWKAFESLALGRPFIVEREPLVEIPEAFRPVPGRHFLEALPGFGGFDAAAPTDDPRSYRILETPTTEQWESGFSRLEEQLRDRALCESMQRECRRFAEERLTPEFVFEWLREEIGREQVGGMPLS